MPENAKKCHRCNNSNFHPEFRNQESRIAQYFVALRQAELWPLAVLSPSVTRLAQSMTRAIRSLRHECAGGVACPLQQQVLNLSMDALEIRGKVTGLCLDCLRKDQVSSLTEPSDVVDCRVGHCERT